MAIVRPPLVELSSKRRHESPPSSFPGGKEKLVGAVACCVRSVICFTSIT
jgi:hypothetical protein